MLAQDKDAVYAGTKPAQPLAIRANHGDCVAITLTNEIPDATAFDDFSKVNMHIHHVQFDVQGSDGVIAGIRLRALGPALQGRGPDADRDRCRQDATVCSLST